MGLQMTQRDSLQSGPAAAIHSLHLNKVEGTRRVKDVGRFWLAAALAPLSVPALFALTTLYSGSGFETPFIAYIATIAAVSYIGFLVFGLPFVLLLRAKGRLTFAALFLGGIVAGPLFVILMQVWSGEPVTFQGAFAQAAIMFTVLSVAVAMLFGLIAQAKTV